MFEATATWKPDWTEPVSVKADKELEWIRRRSISVEVSLNTRHRYSSENGGKGTSSKWAQCKRQRAKRRRRQETTPERHQLPVRHRRRQSESQTQTHPHQRNHGDRRQYYRVGDLRQSERRSGADWVSGTVADGVDALRTLLGHRRLLLCRVGVRNCAVWSRLRLHLRSVWSPACVPEAVGGGDDRSAVLTGHCRTHFLLLRHRTSVSRLRPARLGRQAPRCALYPWVSTRSDPSARAQTGWLESSSCRVWVCYSSAILPCRCREGTWKVTLEFACGVATRTRWEAFIGAGVSKKLCNFVSCWCVQSFQVWARQNWTAHILSARDARPVLVLRRNKRAFVAKWLNCLLVWDICFRQVGHSEQMDVHWEQPVKTTRSQQMPRFRESWKKQTCVCTRAISCTFALALRKLVFVFCALCTNEQFYGKKAVGSSLRHVRLARIELGAGQGCLTFTSPAVTMPCFDEGRLTINHLCIVLQTITVGDWTDKTEMGTSCWGDAHQLSDRILTSGSVADVQNLTFVSWSQPRHWPTSHLITDCAFYSNSVSQLPCRFWNRNHAHDKVRVAQSDIEWQFCTSARLLIDFNCCGRILQNKTSATNHWRGEVMKFMVRTRRQTKALELQRQFFWTNNFVREFVFLRLSNALGSDLCFHGALPLRLCCTRATESEYSYAWMFRTLAVDQASFDCSCVHNSWHEVLSHWSDFWNPSISLSPRRVEWKMFRPVRFFRSCWHSYKRIFCQLYPNCFDTKACFDLTQWPSASDKNWQVSILRTVLTNFFLRCRLQKACAEGLSCSCVCSGIDGGELRRREVGDPSARHLHVRQAAGLGAHHHHRRRAAVFRWALLLLLMHKLIMAVTIRGIRRCFQGSFYGFAWKLFADRHATQQGPIRYDPNPVT